MPNQIFNALGHRMDYLIARQGVIAGNIANADTPNYLAKDLTFSPNPENTFAMRVTNARHLGGTPNAGAVGKLTEDSRFIQHNGNSVRQDLEALKQNQTSLDYRLMTQLYTAQMQLQRTAIGRQQ
ncbi:MAG: flagellar basal body rod protein FlgB [Alphaproteobacteria bacterium]|nr:flagellar basal body rod protein FlgB [Alphaproteobacteria bacterium]